MTSLFRRVSPVPAGNKKRPCSEPDEDSGTAPTLMTLPPEIHLMISKQLIYPDALSLKFVNRHFYHLVDTGVRLKVDWLVERRRLHLECPNNRRCDLGSDLRFCRGSVSLLMQRRREHIECESRPGLGCLIYGTRTCAHARQLRTRIKRWMHNQRNQYTAETGWTLLGLHAIIIILALLVLWWRDGRKSLLPSSA